MYVKSFNLKMYTKFYVVISQDSAASPKKVKRQKLPFPNVRKLILIHNLIPDVEDAELSIFNISRNFIQFRIMI